MSFFFVQKLDQTNNECLFTGKNHLDYLYSTCWKEREWTSKYGKPQTNDFPHNTILEGEVAPGQYVDLLDKYLAIYPYLLPEDCTHPMNRPTLRHPGKLLGNTCKFTLPDKARSQPNKHLRVRHLRNIMHN